MAGWRECGKSRSSQRGHGAQREQQQQAAPARRRTHTLPNVPTLPRAPPPLPLGDPSSEELFGTHLVPVPRAVPFSSSSSSLASPSFRRGSELSARSLAPARPPATSSLAFAGAAAFTFSFYCPPPPPLSRLGSKLSGKKGRFAAAAAADALVARRRCRSPAPAPLLLVPAFLFPNLRSTFFPFCLFLLAVCRAVLVLWLVFMQPPVLLPAPAELPLLLVF